MKKKYAFMTMGPHFKPEQHTAMFAGGRVDTYIFTVRNFEEAKAQVLQCMEDGFGVMEICGAFGEEKARELMALAEGRMGIGFVINLPGQQPLFDEFWRR